MIQVLVLSKITLLSLVNRWHLSQLKGLTSVKSRIKKESQSWIDFQTVMG